MDMDVFDIDFLQEQETVVFACSASILIACALTKSAATTIMSRLLFIFVLITIYFKIYEGSVFFNFFRSVGHAAGGRRLSA